MSRIVSRVLVDLIILGLLIAGWWPIAIVLAIYGNWVFGNYFEFILFGIIYDSLFGYDNDFGILGYLGTILTLLLFSIITFSKNLIRR